MAGPRLTIVSQDLFDPIVESYDGLLNRISVAVRNRSDLEPEPFENTTGLVAAGEVLRSKLPGPIELMAISGSQEGPSSAVDAGF